jgi:hypothetical protein
VVWGHFWRDGRKKLGGEAQELSTKTKKKKNKNSGK